MEASVFHSANYLITQVTICPPFQEKVTLAIFEPFRDAVVDFLKPVIEAWSDVAYVVSFFASVLHQPTPDPEETSWIGEMYHSIRLNAQSARVCLPILWQPSSELRIRSSISSVDHVDSSSCFAHRNGLGHRQREWIYWTAYLSYLLASARCGISTSSSSTLLVCMIFAVMRAV